MSGRSIIGGKEGGERNKARETIVRLVEKKRVKPWRRCGQKDVKADRGDKP
jgi:hypothetical protein